MAPAVVRPAVVPLRWWRLVSLSSVALVVLERDDLNANSKTSVERAYMQSDLLDLRREVMQAWADAINPRCETEAAASLSSARKTVGARRMPLGQSELIGE